MSSWVYSLFTHRMPRSLLGLPSGPLNGKKFMPSLCAPNCFNWSAAVSLAVPVNGVPPGMMASPQATNRLAV